jgi:hypothetical protein
MVASGYRCRIKQKCRIKHKHRCRIKHKHRCRIKYQTTKHFLKQLIYARRHDRLNHMLQNVFGAVARRVGSGWCPLLCDATEEGQGSDIPNPFLPYKYNSIPIHANTTYIYIAGASAEADGGKK